MPKLPEAHKTPEIVRVGKAIDLTGRGTCGRTCDGVDRFGRHLEDLDIEELES